MVSIRLRVPLSFHHCEIPAGTVISVPAGIAQMFVMREAAEMTEPEHAVIEPNETRAKPGRPRKVK